MARFSAWLRADQPWLTAGGAQLDAHVIAIASTACRQVNAIKNKPHQAAAVAPAPQVPLADGVGVQVPAAAAVPAVLPAAVIVPGVAPAT